MFNLFKKMKPIQKNELVAPVSGSMFPIEQVNDMVFSQKIMGDGVAFQLDGEVVSVCAPVSGTLSAVFPTGHAFGITTPDGMDFMVHVGIDTVGANGEGFALLGKNQGEKVKAGDPIVEVNLKALAEKYDMSTMLIVTNDNGKKIKYVDFGKVEKGQFIAAIE